MHLPGHNSELTIVELDLYPWTAGGMTLCKAEGALRPSKKLCAGHRTLPLDFLPTRHITYFLCSYFKAFTLHTTVKMSKPFNPEEAENLEDVRPRVHTV